MATRKQKALAKKILQDPSMEMGKAMREVGYSVNTRPHDVANTEGWQELLEKILPDDKLIAKHNELLEATKQISARNGMGANAETDDFIEVPDYQIQAKALELGYKVKGKLKDNNVNILNQGGDMSLEFTK